MSPQKEQVAPALPRHGGFGGGGRRPVIRPKNFKGTLKRLMQSLGAERGRLSLVFAIVLFDAVLMLLSPYLLGKSIDAMVGKEATLGFFFMTICALVIAYLADGLLTLLQGWIMAGLSQRIVANLRDTLFGKLQKLPVAYFDSHTHGEMMSRLTNDIDNVSTSISQSITQLMAGLIILMGSFVMMLVLSPILAFATLLTVPLVFLLTRTIAGKTNRLFKEQQAELGRLNGHIEESISGLQVIKAFNHEDQVIDEFAAINERLYKVGLHAQIWSGFLMPILNVINNLGFAVVAIVGGILAVKGMITVGVIASFLSYSRQFVRPLNEMANIFNLLQSGVAGAERVFDVLDEREEPDDTADAVALTQPRGHVAFEHVSFGYHDDQPILHDISFEAKAGSRIALVGPTGAGKTTIINLLTRFYDVTGGMIRLDGRDIRDYTRDSLRKSFGIVLQDTYLFAGTIRENIKYGNPGATDEEVEAAAALANADAFIRRLPKRYDTMLTENGSNLSQGQRQLLAIARVILAKPSLLILDEATSSIDTRTEIQIQQALLTIMKGRTSFIIAHRLNTIRDADTIMVVDQGRIIERGNHEELMERKGFYYQLFSNQFKNLEAAAMES